MYYSTTMIGYRLAEQIKDMSKPVVASGIAAIASWYLLELMDWSAAWAAVTGGLAFSVLYIGISHLANIEGYVLIKNKLKTVLPGILRKRAGGTQA
jgi:hypothetical protein